MSDEELTLIEERMLTLLSTVFVPLDNEQHDPTRPDLFGQSFTVLFDAAFHALLNNRSHFVVALFPKLIVGTERARNRLIRDLADVEILQRVGFVTSPILGLMELSGYAILTSELFDNEVWHEVKSTWDQLLSPDYHPEFADQMIVALQFHESVIGSDTSGIERTRRRIEFDNLLRSRGIYQADTMYGEEGVSPSPSPILAAFAPYDVGGIEESMDLFAVEYLAKRRGFDLSTLPRSARSLMERINRNDA
ncbi:MAG TPA: hypothetical protein VGZ68_09415 [Acidimicrobiales bacterium]|nr:hypothetical protein [Acidimicrobiales bacterium]